MLRRRHALGASRDLDGIGIIHPDALQKFPEPQLKTVVKTPQDGRVTLIFVTRSVEVKHLSHRTLHGESFLPPNLTRAAFVILRVLRGFKLFSSFIGALLFTL
jgi:hypothetical protein